MKKLPKSVQKYLKEGLFDNGWKIEISFREGDKIATNRRFISNAFFGDNISEIIPLEIEVMIKDFKKAGYIK